MRKRIRLKSFDYLGRYRYFVAICTYAQTQVFTVEGHIRIVSTILQEISKAEGFLLWAYCFMPDHLHILVEGLHEESDFRRFVKLFKQKSGYQCKQVMGMKLWQEDYFERILRREETTLKAMEYILNNPVRRGLVSYPEEYPFSYSLLNNNM